MSATTVDITGATVSAGDYVAHASTGGRGVSQKVYRVKHVYANGVCEVFDPTTGWPNTIGCLPSQGVKLTNYVPK